MKKLSKIRPEILEALLEHIGDPVDILNDTNRFLELKKAGMDTVKKHWQRQKAKLH